MLDIALYQLLPAVRKFKVIVVLVLVAAAIAVTVLVYKFTSDAEQQSLQTEYDDYAAKFITNFHHLQVMRQWAAYTVAGMFTARCINAEGPDVRPWPNITLPDFADQVRGAMVLSHGTTIEFSPLFANDDGVRRGWEAYAVENEDAAMHVPEWAMMQQHGGDTTGAESTMEEEEHIMRGKKGRRVTCRTDLRWATKMTYTISRLEVGAVRWTTIWTEAPLMKWERGVARR